MKQQWIPKVCFICKNQAISVGTIKKQGSSNYVTPSSSAEMSLVKRNWNMYQGKLNLKSSAPGKQ